MDHGRVMDPSTSATDPLIRADGPVRHESVRIGPGALPGDLARPADAFALVLFVHGSGSSRLSPRNRAVAAALQTRGLATLLFDLLDEREAADRRLVFDIPLLTARVAQALAWVATRPDLAALPRGLFGASTGSAAALCAAADPASRVAAVVSRGGRPDLAWDALPGVTAPTLLLVGGADTEVLALNHAAAARLAGPHRLEVVPGASHLFEEPGALEAVADAAADWFVRQLAAKGTR
jgi:pimeloyl-ACP methyl ester carboxylesterase